jgi:N-acetylneuraminic acid mutarotase
MTTARIAITACASNSRIYIFGGYDGNAPSSKTEEYNHITDSWIEKTPLPTERFLSVAHSVNNKIYVIGGTQFLFFDEILSTVEEYDPATDSWMTKAGMPTPRGAAVSGVVDGKIYVISGRIGFETADFQFPKTNILGRKKHPYLRHGHTLVQL